jgi:hypothetical protein
MLAEQTVYIFSLGIEMRHTYIDSHEIYRQPEF